MRIRKISAPFRHYHDCGARLPRLPWLLAMGIVAGAGSLSAQAQCYRVDYTSPPSSSANDYVDPKYGTWGKWDGSKDETGSSGGLPALINVNSLAFQPSGTLIASGSDVFYNLGQNVYSPEQVLFRCTPDEAGKLYEYYATNGDSTYGGKYEDGKDFGVPEGYRTDFQGIAIRVTNTVTGEYYSRYWKARPLTGLTTDSKGWILVKAKNFSGVRVEIFRINNSAGDDDSGLYNRKQPAAYIAFKGGSRSSNLSVGADSGSKYDGFYSYWPGAVNLYRRITIRRSASCLVSNVTPNVNFHPVSVAELNQGATREAPIQVQFSCQTGKPANNGLSAFVSGTAANETAMGILVRPENAAAAVKEGFGSAGGGVDYLLSDGYGVDQTVATGVGIRFSDKNARPLMLLGILGNFGAGKKAGWYPVLDGAERVSNSDGVTYYNKTLLATLMKLPGKPVEAGKIKAVAQVIIQVQ